MYIKVQKLPLIKPKVGLSNTELLFIRDSYDNYVFDSHIVTSGSDFNNERTYRPYLITEIFNNITLHHHFIQEPNKNKTFCPLSWIGSEWLNNKHSLMLNIPVISKLRDEFDLDHSYLNLFDAAYEFYKPDNKIIDLGEDINKQIFKSREADKYALASVKLDELKRNHPFVRNGNYSNKSNCGLIDSIYDDLDKEDDIKIVNDSIIKNAFKSMPEYPEISVLLKYLSKKKQKKLTSTDLNNILKMFTEQCVDNDPKEINNDLNNIEQKNLITNSKSTINIAKLTSIINEIRSLDFSIKFERDKEDHNKFVFVKFTSDDCSPECDEFSGVDPSDLSKYITSIALVFKFFPKIEKIELIRNNSIINIRFVLDSDETKNLSFNIAESMITTPALL